MGLCSQICLMLWKNWLLQKRKICVSIFEVLLPVLLALILLGIRAAVPETNDGARYYSRKQIISSASNFPDNAIIGFTPNMSETRQVMDNVQQLLTERTFSRNRRSHNYSVKAFDTEDEALAFIKLNSVKMRHLIVFNGLSKVSTSLPAHLDFTIRPYTDDSEWFTGLKFPVFQTGGPSDSNNLYSERGVLCMQSLVAEAFARYWLQKSQNQNSTNFGVYTQHMAYPPYNDDPLIPMIQSFLPIVLVFSFIISVIINTKNLIYEKEKKLKESMKLMGLTQAAYWISWFITFSIYVVPVLLLYTILCSLSIAEYPVLVHSDGSLFFVFLLCYALAMITFCFMISTFVQKANVGAAISGIAFIVFYVPYFFIWPKYGTLGKAPKIVAGLLFNCAMALGANSFGIYEGTGEGAQWSNFYKPTTPDDNLSLLECMIMLLVDSVIHILITWYMDNIMPGEFGVPRPFYFCFTKAYWCEEASAIDTGYDNDVPQTKNFETDPSNKVAGISICNLRKTFGGKVAVEGTTLNMYEGQITVLLGHNGAGKTTTMSMLTGFIPPTSGTATVNGYDIRNNIAKVRSSLGLCPQHNILFDTLTVFEHLKFYAKLKGSLKIDKEVAEMVQKVRLEDKKNTKSQFLSGGQKRKLSVGIALIGGSKIVILDEPTSGMDPAARRQTWNILQEARQNRTIVLSTHYMDEADLLGDRIAIMAEGVVKCCGTSMFLKKLYGTGYHLVVVKQPDCDVDNLTRAVQSFVPTSQLETIVNTEVTYLLPQNESSKFAPLFHYLDVNKEQLGITSFGTSATTMEEVFIKVGEEEYEVDDVTNRSAEEQNNFLPSAQNVDLVKTSTSSTNVGLQNEATNFIIHENTSSHGTFGAARKVGKNIEMSDTDIMAFNKGFTKKTGLSLEISRFRALFVKKAINTWRNRFVTLTQLLLPVIFTIFGMLVDEYSSQKTSEPSLKFDLSPFGKTYIPYTDGINSTSDQTHFKDLYNSLLNESQYTEYFKLKDQETFDNYTLQRANESGTPFFNREMIIGMEVIAAEPPETISAVAFYNGQPYHSQPIAVNYLMNTFLQFTLNNSFSLQSSINPLPKDEKAEAESNINASQGFSVGFFVSFGMAFLTSCFIFFLIKERQVGAKHMQVLSGVGPITYWIPTFLWDFITYIVPSILLVVVFAAFSKAAYVDDGRWGLVLLVLIAYGWAVITLIYAVQFVFTSPPTGVVVLIILSIFSGLVTTLVVLILQLPDTVKIAKTLDWIFMVIFPNYNLATCLSSIYTNYLNLKMCQPYQAICSLINSSCCKDNCGDACFNFENDYLSWEKPGIGAYLLFMALQGALFCMIVLLLEYHILQKLWYCICGTSSNVEPKDFVNYAQQVEDNDVAAERHRINSSSAAVLSSSDSLVLINLYKRYNNFVAVDRICLGIPEQECFGLLGQNGAGKTTTFKMLTGDVMVTGGNAYLRGYDVKNNIKQVQANMGYCPQFDALIEQMTGRETLTMYARLRGIPEDNIKVVVNTVIDVLMLRPHADKRAGNYSGGNKRKLSTGIALIGDPPFIMLDEPSSGMDPLARRTLWDILSKVRASGRTLVLTSHSMEECDALCTRLAIMVNGRFVCLGSPQQLKNKFGQGYTLITKLGTLEDGRTAPNQPVIDFITSHFPGSKVFDDHQGYVHFQVPDATIKLADVFYLMEATKQNLHVEDYSVHQTTLEQIFLTFTKAQVLSES